MKPKEYNSGSYFKFEIPENSEVEKKLREFLDNVKACVYCRRPLDIYADVYGVVSQLELTKKPFEIENMVMCSDCFAEIKKAFLDLADKYKLKAGKE